MVATEIAFARMAREEGQWTAFAEFAADDAVMFVPEPVNARDWLGTQADPPESVQWQPHRVWSSCDGSLAVSTGAYTQPNGAFGRFVTVWERQDNFTYKFVLDLGEPLSEPLAAPEMVQADVAECGETPTPVVMSGRNLTYRANGNSNDYSLYWQVDLTTEGSREFDLYLWRDGARSVVLTTTTTAPIDG